MHLISTDNTTFELNLVNYQFPENTRNKWDANWLRIAIRVQTPYGSWSFVDPCLLTWEIEELAHWFSALAKTASTDADVSFLEPNLAFSTQVSAAGRQKITVRFDLLNTPKTRPSWQELETVYDLQLDVSLAEIADAAQSLRTELARFPVRAKE